MRRMLGVLVVLAGMAAGAAKSDDAADIAAVIGDQMQAFSARDLDRAFSHASPTIKGLFGDPANFGRMVAQGYPTVWDNNETRFMDLREVGGALWQRVKVTGTDGTVRYYDYQMVRIGDGWQINAVQPVELPGTGV